MIADEQDDWNDAELYCPYQCEQVLMYEFAECVATRAFLKLVNLPFSVEQRPNAEFMSPTGKVPFLRMNSTLVPGFSEIVDFVGDKGIKLTNTLSPVELTDMNALISLINECLTPAEMYFCWKDKDNYNLITYFRYRSVYFFPLNLFLPAIKRREVCGFLDSVGWDKMSLDDVVKRTEICFEALSIKLGENRYIMGDEPTELDALAFGHLYTIITTDMPSTHLSTSLKKFPNLLNYCIMFDKEIFKIK